MLTKILAVGIAAGLIAYASGALAHGPNPRSYTKGHPGYYYTHPYGSGYGSGYGRTGWSLSFSLGSSYGGYTGHHYYDRSYHGHSGPYRSGFGRGVHHVVPHHAIGPACGNYGYHRH